MYQNSLLKQYETSIVRIPAEQLSIIIEYLTELEKEAEKDFANLAKKSVIQLDYRTEALIKNGIDLGYKDILERFKRIRSLTR